MMLLVDIGNSRVKWAGRRGGVWCARGTLPVAEAERLAAVLAEQDPAWVGLSCVADTGLRARIEAILAERPHAWLTPVAHAHGLVNGYARPETLGADRYASLLACWRAGRAPCVVVSAGTALTVDALSGEGEFLGGMILPGVTLMRRALAVGTAGVAAGLGVWHDFPGSTDDAVTTGTITALACTVASMQARLARRIGREVPVVLSGGDAEVLLERLSGPVLLESSLVLEGLLWWARDLGVSDA